MSSRDIAYTLLRNMSTDGVTWIYSFFSFQRVNVIGRVLDQQIIVDPSVIDVGLCYLTSSVQMASFQLRNTSRVVVPYEIKLPREMSKHAELSHSKGYLKAGSSMEIFIRLRLKCLYIIFESLYFIINTQHTCRYTYNVGDYNCF